MRIEQKGVVGVDCGQRPDAPITALVLGIQAHRRWLRTLTKADLVEAVAAATSFLKQDAEEIVNAVLATMTEALRSGESIELRGFGSFRFRHRPARVGRNPKTGASVNVPPKRVCYFKPSRGLRDL